jgi:hypothetical protein
MHTFNREKKNNIFFPPKLWYISRQNYDTFPAKTILGISPFISREPPGQKILGASTQRWHAFFFKKGDTLFFSRQNYDPFPAFG